MNANRINVVKIFDCMNLSWRSNWYTNEVFVDATLEVCRKLLKNRGYLFLNEVYQKLGFPLTQQGQTAGWIYDKDHEDDIMWTIWRVREEMNNVGITFEPMENILEALPEQ